MMTKELLQAVKARNDLKSDAELARLLESSTPVISRYMTGQRVMDDYTAVKVAELLEIDPMIVIAQANAEREKDEKKRAFWGKFAAAASLVMTVGFFTTIAPKSAYASTTCSGEASGIPIMAVWWRWLRGLSLSAFLQELAGLLGGNRILRTS